MPNFSFLVCLELEVIWLERTTKTKQNKNLVDLEASLSPAEAEFGSVAKADQNKIFVSLALLSPAYSIYITLV